MLFQNKLIQTMLKNRGLSGDYFDAIEDDSHGALLHMDALCERLHVIKTQGQHLVILTDFDMDGIVTGTLSYAGLSELGFYVSLYRPNPKESYGFTKQTILDILKKFPNVSAILTGDVGISCGEGVKAAAESGIEVLVTDHHEESDGTPLVKEYAACVVNPMQEGESYVHPKICGGYVMYQCLMYYAELYENIYEQEQIRRLCVFAGIGTISDAMPVLYENRRLIKDAVAVCRMVYGSGDAFTCDSILGCDIYRRAFKGIYVMLSVFAEAGKITKSSDIDADFFAFYFAPTFNSVKRVGKNFDMERVYGVFFGPEPDVDAAYLISLNEKRKEDYKKYRDILESEIGTEKQPFYPYLILSEAPSGILGLLAQYVVDTSGCPCAALRFETPFLAHGSGRSPDWYPFLDRTGRGAGHNEAFGIKLEDKFALQELYAYLAKDVPVVYETLSNTCVEATASYDFIISDMGDGDCSIDIDLFWGYLREIRRMQPFGKGLPRPNILFRFDPKQMQYFVMGKEKNHLKLFFDHGFSVICWNQAELLKTIQAMDVCGVAGRLEKNYYDGEVSVVFTGDLITDEQKLFPEREKEEKSCDILGEVLDFLPWDDLPVSEVVM